MVEEGFRRGLQTRSQTRVARIFPNAVSCLRLASALLKEWHEDWITGRCYLRMELLYELEADGERRPSDPLEDAA